MIIQTIILIFSQIDTNKIQSRPPTGDLFFTFLLILKYKTDFPLVIIYHTLSQLRSVWRFVAMFLQRFPSIAGSYCVRFRSCTVVAWHEQHGDTSIVLTERERKDCFEQRTKQRFFCRPQEKIQSWLETFGSHTKLRIWHLIHSSWFFSAMCIIGVFALNFIH